jgi:uncharacterized protein YndB with AHSA1/START domain
MTATTPIPTGRIVKGSHGLDLLVTRTLPGSVADAWVSITDPDRTARWIGRWEGIGAPGETIKLQMGFEADSPWADVEIAECDAPHRLRVVTRSGDDSWDLSLELRSVGERSELRFIHHDILPADVGSVGPGWEFYLDQLVAAMTGAPLPDWADYFPAQRDHFDSQVQ